MCYFIICSNIQSSIIILVINCELVSDPLYVTCLTFDLDIFYLFSILTFDLTLKMGKIESNRLVTRLVTRFYSKSFKHFNVLQLYELIQTNPNFSLFC